MEEDRPLEVVPVQPPGQAAQQHHRFLQPLGAVDGHDGHTAPLPAWGGQGQSPGLAHPLQAQPELEERPAPSLLQTPRQGIEGEQAALPLLPPVHGPEQAQQVGPLIDVPDQLAAGAVPCPEAQLLQLRQEIPARLVPPAGGLDHSGIEVPLPLRPEQSQLIS